MTGRTRSTFLLLFLSLAACGDDDDDGQPGVDGGTPDAGSDGGVPALERAQAGGEPSALTRVDDLAYVTIGPRLTIWDLGDPAAPELVGESEPLGANATGVAVLGDFAYVTDRSDLDGQLHVIDVSDPAAPDLVHSLRVSEAEFSVPLGVATDGTRVFVADQEHGIAILDVSTPAEASVTDLIELGGVTSVRVAGNRLYGVSRSFVGNDYVFTAFDLDNELAPLGEAAFSGVNGFDLTDAQLLVTIGAGGTAVYDLTDLTEVEQLFLSEDVRSRAIAVGTSAAWIPADEGVYRLSLGETPTLSAPVAMPVEGANQALAADGLLTVISDRGRLVTVDVSAETPVLRASPEISIAGNAIGVRVAGELFLVADGAGGLRVGTLHDLEASGRGYADVMVDFEDIVVDGDIVYAADWFFGLRVYDISDPDDVVQIGELDTPGAPSAVAVEDGIVYLGESTGGGAVRVIDVSDPTAPQELGFVNTSIVFDLVVRDKIVYTANHTLGDSGGLYVFDATVPATPVLAGSYTECANASGIDLVDDLAIVGCGGEFHLVDVSDTSAPDQVSVFPLTAPSGAWSVAIRGDVAYLGHDTGVSVVDISDPAAPEKVSELSTAYTVRGLDASLPGRLVAAAGLAGIYQWDLD